MSLLSKLFGSRSTPPVEPTMMMEGERLEVILNPTEAQVRQIVLSLNRLETSFVTLTDESGNYVQVAGSRPWCVLERRNITPLRHERAFQHTPNPKYNDGAKIIAGAGGITLQHDEWFLLKDAAEVFVAFLNREPAPSHVQWRSMNEILDI